MHSIRIGEGQGAHTAAPRVAGRGVAEAARTLGTPNRVRARARTARGLGWAGVAVAGLVAGCDHAVADRAGAAPVRAGANSRAYVTARAAGALDANGFFSRAGRVPRAPDELTAAQAVTLASAYIRTAGPYLRGAWEYMRGAPVRLTELAPCDGAYYAATPYEDPPLDVVRGVRNALDSKWIVEFCDGGVPAVSVTIASHATGIPTSATGRLQVPGSNPFYSEGIPASRRGAIASPDSAVQLLARTTGAQIASEPELVLPAFPYAPQLARWRVTLAAPVRVRTAASGATSTVQEVYQGLTAPAGASGTLATTADVPAQAPILRWQDPATGATRDYRPLTRRGYTATLAPVEAHP